MGVLSGFDKFFSNNNTADCPTQNYKLVNKADLSDYQGLIVVLDTNRYELKYFPSQAVDKLTEETLELFIQAETAGFVQGRWEFSLTLLSEESNSELLRQGPMFSWAPPPYYEVKIYADNKNYFENIDLPTIISPSNNVVQKINKENIVIYRADSQEEVEPNNLDTLVNPRSWHSSEFSE
jgi:hypothetical protein